MGKKAGDVLVEDLIGAWTDVLGITDITPTDNFFELGGDSLNAEDLVLLIEDRFGVALDPSLIFEEATPHAMAEHLRAAGEGGRLHDAVEGIL